MPALFRTILVAADFSPGSREAFRIACTLCTDEKARMIVLHVAEPRFAADEPVYFGQTSVHCSRIERPQEEREALLNRLRLDYIPNRPLIPEYMISEGAAAESILEQAEKSRCDLIALGTHGRKGLDRLLAGSVAEAVLRRSPCPVLALRTSGGISTESGLAEQSSADAARQGPDTPARIPMLPGTVPMPFPIRTILHPTDFSEGSDAAYGVAYLLAHDIGARLIVLHVAPVDEAIIPPAELNMQRNIPEMVHRLLDEAEFGYPVEAQVRYGDAVAVIPRVADEFHCNLIVMGTHGRTALGRLLMGSVAEGVLRGASCPVLVAKWTSGWAGKEKNEYHDISTY